MLDFQNGLPILRKIASVSPDQVNYLTENTTGVSLLLLRESGSI
jgi:hypothetical protein